MVSFIDEHRKVYGVGPMSAVLPIAPSTYYEQKARQADPERVPKRIQRDRQLGVEIRQLQQRLTVVLAKSWVGESLPKHSTSIYSLYRKEVLRRFLESGQYLAIRYSERLADEGINPSVGSAGDSYDNALAESVIGLFKTEVIRRKGPWKSLESVEYATLEWVDWFNNRRLLEPIGNIPPVECESAYYAMEEAPVLVAGLT
jgi:hypothetical protein